LDINEVILEVIALPHGEVVNNSISLQTQPADGLPLIRGHRVQLQQVILNLIVNAVEAMSGVNEGVQELLIGTGKDSIGCSSRYGIRDGDGTIDLRQERRIPGCRPSGTR
jgi:signal transduction histidine kinase